MKMSFQSNDQTFSTLFFLHSFAIHFSSFVCSFGSDPRTPNPSNGRRGVDPPVCRHGMTRPRPRAPPPDPPPHDLRPFQDGAPGASGGAVLVYIPTSRIGDRLLRQFNIHFSHLQIIFPPILKYTRPRHPPRVCTSRIT